MPTANLGMVLPVTSADADTWGDKLNAALGQVDAVFSGSGTSVGLNVGSGKTLTLAGTLTAYGASITGKTGTGNLVLASSPSLTAPSLGAATAFTLSINGGTISGGVGLAVNGNSELIGDVHVAHCLANGSGGGTYTATGFGITGIYGFNSLSTDYGGGFQVQAGGSGGVNLPGGGTSWTAVLERAKKKDFQPIENPYDIITNLNAELGLYQDEPPGAKLRPFLFYEDAIRVWPYAAHYMPPQTLTAPDTGEVMEVPESKTLAYEQFIPLILAALKEQASINSDMTARLGTLEAKAA